MGKLLFVLIWLLIGHAPVAAIPDEAAASRLLGLGEINAVSIEDQLISADRLFEGGVGARAKAISIKTNALPVGLNVNSASWTSPDVLDSDLRPTGLQMLNREAQGWHEAEGHHPDTSTGLVARHSSKYHADSGQEDAESRDETDPGIQPERLEGDQIAVANRRCIGPLCAEVGRFRSVGLLIAISGVVFGTFYSLGIALILQPIITRRWYLDALLGQVVAFAGHVGVGYIILGIYP